jgi:hypothetical protein
MFWTKRIFDTLTAQIEKIEIYDNADAAIPDTEWVHPKAVVMLYSSEPTAATVASAVARALGISSYRFLVTSREMQRPLHN